MVKKERFTVGPDFVKHAIIMKLHDYIKDTDKVKSIKIGLLEDSIVVSKDHDLEIEVIYEQDDRYDNGNSLSIL